MLKHPELTERRISKGIAPIRELIHSPRLGVEAGAWQVQGEPVPLELAMQAGYSPFIVGDKWGAAWSTVWFRVEGHVPEAWRGREVVLLMRLSDGGIEGFTAEGLVYSQGRPARALNPNRSEIEITKHSAGGERFEIYVEAAANVSDPTGTFIPAAPGPLFALTQLELACVNRSAFDFYFDFKVAAEAMLALPENSQRRAELRYALNESLNRLNTGDINTVPHAREALREVLAKKCGGTVHQVSAIGHAHIDTAWLWPLRESIRKCARTFSTAVDYMDRYPEYVFGCSQAQHYAWMKAYYPEIYQQIRERVKRGQWEPIGSMWVEVDCNLASGESLIRQILHGKRFFQKEFEYETKDAWIPDVFGYSAALPQIFKGCGIDYFVTQKISWNQFNKFPHHTFWWEGIDGTRIFTHFPPADTYNATMAPRELIHNVTSFREHSRSSRSLYVYGFGDGGGGPTIDMLEQARRLSDFDGLPQLTQEKVLSFLQKAEKEARDLAVWVGELYLELHRGTYTTQARNKLGNRRSEFLLRNAEFFDAVTFAHLPVRAEKAADPQRSIYDVAGLEAAHQGPHATALDRAWSLVLLNQFHDIIPGSSIGAVYKDSAVDYAAIFDLGNSVLRSSLGLLDAEIDTAAFRRPVRIANTLNFERTEVVAMPDNSLRQVTVPPCGYVVLDALDPTDAVVAGTVATREDDEVVLDNGILRVRIGPDGLMSSLWDREAEREVLGAGGGNLLQVHPDTPNDWDAWDIDVFYKEQCSDLREVEDMEIIDSHPQRAAVRVKRAFGRSRLIQDIVLTNGSRRIDFVTEVDWQESHRLLKAAFPVNILSPVATYEIQFGHVERPTHYNTSWDLARFEVCAHKWADLSEADYGVALLNDCKYGYDIHGHIMRLSLLRSPAAPDPDADRGRHVFTYSLFPHPGSLQIGRVIEQAYQLNVPLLVDPIEVHPGRFSSSHSFFEINRPGTILESLKVAENGAALIVRLYEAYGSRGAVELRTTLPIKRVAQTDLLEREKLEIPIDNGTVTFSIKPFEIITLRMECGDGMPA